MFVVKIRNSFAFDTFPRQAITCILLAAKTMADNDLVKKSNVHISTQCTRNKHTALISIRL